MSGPRPAGALVTIALSAFALAGCEPRDSYRGMPLDPILTAPDLALPGAGGTQLSLARSDGRVSLVTFGYTSCPDVCPTTLADWRKLRAKLGDRAARVRFVFVSVDWRNDSPEVAAGFARRFDPSFAGVVADSAALRKLLPAFRAAARYDTLPGRVLGVTHTDYSYLVDPAGRIRLAYQFPPGVPQLEHDLRVLLREARD